MKNGLFNLWNLNFVKESFEKIYAKSKTLKKKSLIILSILLSLIGLFSICLNGSYFLNLNNEKELNQQIMVLVIMIGLVVFDIFLILYIIFSKRSHQKMMTFFFYLLISLNFQGVTKFLSIIPTCNVRTIELKLFISIILSLSFEFYYKLSFIYLVGIHHYSLALGVFLNFIFGSFFYNFIISDYIMMTVFYARLLIDIGFIAVSYKTIIDSKRLFYTENKIEKQALNLSLLDNFNCGIVTIDNFNHVKKTNNFLRNVFNLNVKKPRNFLNIKRKISDSNERIFKTETFLDNIHKNIDSSKSLNIKRYDNQNNSFFQLNAYNKSEDEYIIDTLLNNLDDISEKLSPELIECLKTNKAAHFLLKVGVSKEFVEFSYIGVKMLNIDDNVKNYFEIFIRKGETRVELIFKDISKTKIIEEIQSELNNRTLYLSKLAHEFKNPLMSLNEVSMCIEDKIKRILTKNKEIEEYSQIFSDLLLIRNLSDYLMILVKDTEVISMLDFKKNLIVYYNECELKSLLVFCQSIMKMRISSLSKNIIFSYDMKSNVPLFINMDETRLKQILLNILSNSLKFTDNGFISLNIEREDYPENYDLNKFFLKFTIEDNGIGMNKEELDNIFKPFNKANTNNNKNGSGLGICIVKEMIENLGGSIKISSEKVTKVEFKIPIDNSKLNLERNINFASRRKSDESSSSRDSQSKINRQFKYNQYRAHNQKDDIILNNFKSSYDVRNFNNNVNINININLKEDLIIQKESRHLSSKENNYIKRIALFNSTTEKVYKSSDKKLQEKNEGNYILELTSNDNIKSINSSDTEKSMVRILIIDDEKYSRNALKRILKKYLDSREEIIYEIIEASDGLEGLFYLIKNFKMENKEINFILSDINMNPVGGLQLGKIISDIDYLKSKGMKFYLLSAGKNEGNKVSYVDGYFEKPINNHVLNKIFDNLL